MAYPKNKSEVYKQIGGINNKVSIYETPKTDVLRLENFDFSEPGALTTRPGFTNALGGITVAIGSRINDIFPLNGLNLGIKHFFGTDQNIFQYSWTMGFASSFISVTTTNNNWVHANLNNYAFICSVNAFYKIADYAYTSPIASFRAPGTYGGLFGLPAPSGLSGVFSITTAPGLSSAIPGGTQAYYLSYFDSLSYIPSEAESPVPGLIVTRNFLGPVAGPFYIFITSGRVPLIDGLTVPLVAQEYNPEGFVLYRRNVTGYNANDLVVVGETVQGGGSVLADYTGGGPASPLEPSNILPDLGRVADESVISPIASSKFMEFYKGRLFINATGVNYDGPALNRFGNTTLFSEPYEPENFQPENFFITMNQEYQISGYKTYNQSLLIGLSRGIWRLTGDNIDSFVLEPINDEFGFISHKAVVTWKEVCWFLDIRGIVEYNGSTFNLVSTRIEDIIKTINFEAAIDRSQGYYFQDRNEVWFSVPLGDSENPDTVLIYDIVADAWTTFKGFSASAINLIFKGETASTYVASNNIYFGTPSGTLHYFDPVFLSDNGATISTVMRTFSHDGGLGNSIEKQFRRLYLDSGPLFEGITNQIHVSFFADHASNAIYMTRSMFQGASTQSRIDYGIPAKSLGIQFQQGNTQMRFKIYGYTVESRYQRSV